MKGRLLVLLSCLMFVIVLGMTTIPMMIYANKTPIVQSNSGPLIKIISEVSELGPSNVIGNEFTVAVVVENGTDPPGLYGIDLQMNWTTAYIEYVDHETAIPVEDYEDPQDPSPYPGFLHEDVMKMKDTVDESGIPLSEPGTMAWISYVSVYPALKFSGNGTVVVFTFKVIDQPVSPPGEDLTVDIYLHFILTALSDPYANPILHDSLDGHIMLHGIPPGPPPSVDLVSPTQESPAYAQPGTSITVFYSYNETSPKNATIQVYNQTHVIGTATVTDLVGGTDEERSDVVSIEASAAEGYYNVNITMYNTADVSGEDAETNATLVDGTSPVIEEVTQSPPSDNVQPHDSVKVNATVTDMLSGVAQVILNYTTNNITWTSLTMDEIGTNIYDATIPEISGCHNVTYMIIAEDKAGNTVTAGMDYEYGYHVIPEFSVLALIPILTMMAIVVLTLKKSLRKRTQRYM